MGRETQKDESSSNPSSSSPDFPDPRKFLDPTQGNTMRCLWGILRIKRGDGCEISPHITHSSLAISIRSSPPELLLPWAPVQSSPGSWYHNPLLPGLQLGLCPQNCPLEDWAPHARGGCPRTDGYKQPQAPHLCRDHPGCDQSCRSDPSPHSIRPRLNLA